MAPPQERLPRPVVTNTLVGANAGYSVQAGSIDQVNFYGAPARPLARRAFLPECGLPPRFGPSFLLRSEYRTIPFHGRHDELAALTAWRAADEDTGVRLITGPGGQGKTRLALELITGAAEQGWLAGRLRPGCDEQTLWDLCGAGDDTLVVIDYAETQPALLIALFRAAAERPEGSGRLRLLLLARSSVAWWPQLRIHAPDHLAARWDDDDTERALPVLFDRAADRPRRFAEAVTTFAAKLGLSADGMAEPPGLAEDRFGAALALHMAALAALLDHQRPDTPPSAAFRDPAGRVLDHEQRYWADAVRAAELPYHQPRLLRAVMTAATGCGADSREQSVELLGHLPDLAGEHERVLGQYADWVHGLHPGPCWLNPLQPDLLGERLLADALAEQPELAGALARAAVEPDQQGTLWTVLGRAVDRHGAVRSALPAILAAGPDTLWLAGTILVSYLPRPDLLVPALIDAIDDVTDPRILMAGVDGLPHAHRNAALKIAVAERALHRLGDLPERDVAAEAALHSDLADGLVSANRFEESLAALRTAVDLYGEVVGSRPDRYTSRYLRAKANYAAQLDNCDRPDEARKVSKQVAEDARRYGLADDGFLSAQVLWGRSQIFKHLQRPLKAEKMMARAVDKCRAAANSGDGYATAQLPIVIMNLANRQSDLGWHQEALATIEESVTLMRRLDHAYPDPLNPTLPQILYNYAQCLLDRDRPEEARKVIAEAVHRLRRVTEFNTGRLGLLWSAASLWAKLLWESDFSDDAVRAEYAELAALHARDDWPIDGLRGERAWGAWMGYGRRLFEAGDKDEGARWMNRARDLPYGRMARPRFSDLI
ncbi:tetratricopeptide repeat protein [Amycolatopsis mediterranei]|uniref:tetratricopeptide repeat protein n=1 Tax=Amycolatopsis mediterranei TaxID=33910 RepID=UPI003424EC45